MCHDMAIAYLRVKRSYGRFDPGRFGLTIDDFAYDAIAELFQRNDGEEYVSICAFVDRVWPPAGLDDAQAENELRRLVLSSVNQRIFREYGAHDPSLARIIRNVKLALKSHPTATTYEYFGEAMIIPKTSADLLEKNPSIAPEMLSPELHQRMPERPKLNEMLSGLVDILNDQCAYRRMLSVVEAAVLFRGEYSLGHIVDHDTQPDQGLSKEEVKDFIQSVLASIRERHEDFYVGKGKLSQVEYEAHLKAVEEILHSELVSEDGDINTYFETIEAHMSNLTKEKYKQKHRAILEYLVKRAKTELASRLKKEL